MREDQRRAHVERLEQLLRERRPGPASILEMGMLYRSLSAAVSVSDHDRDRIEGTLLRAHRAISAPNEGARPALGSLMRRVPVTVFRNPYVRFSVLLFYTVFFASAAGAYLSRDYAVAVLGEATLQQYQEMHKDPERHFTLGEGFAGTGYYIVNNITLDLLGYATGLLAGLGSVFFTLYNGVFLGTTIGFLLQTEAREGILKWIFGHAPFELTAVGISAGAGLQTGLAFLQPGARSRMAALTEEGRAALPSLVAAVFLTGVAAFIEGFLAPLNIPVPYKIGVGVICLVFLVAYFVLPSLRRTRSREIQPGGRGAV